MKLAELFSAFAKHHTSAVILASGRGSRMNSEIPKQFMTVNGRTVLERSIDAFEECGYIDDIVVVVPAEYLRKTRDMVAYNNYKKVISVVAGGETRQASAFIGMENIPEKATHIAIHDAARCLVTPEMISMVTASAFRTGSSFASFAPKDTIKLLSKRATTETKDKQLIRSNLVCASTPQVFKVDVYRAGAYIARENGFIATDDCSLVENVGFTCHPVDCGDENIKITTPVDVYTAEFILKQRAIEQAKREQEEAEKKNKKSGKKAGKK